jgi:Invasion associated locus B (IalB) protein
MIRIQHLNRVVPLVLAALLALPGIAVSQQQQQQPAPRQRPEQKPPAKPAPQAQRPAQPAAPAAPAVGGVQPNLLGQFADWGAYTASPGGRKVCFALARPSSSQTNPPNRPRDPAHIFISTRPAEQVRNEVSVIIGYTFKDKPSPTIEVGPTKLNLYTEKDGAWISNAGDEARLVEAMRRGSDLVVKGTSSRGTQTTDTFSLKGLGQALDRVAQECRE